MRRFSTRDTSAGEIAAALAVPAEDGDAADAVSAILKEVKTRGDEAVKRYTRRFDGVDTELLFAAPERIRNARLQLEKEEPELAAALRLAIHRVRAYHEKQKAEGWWMQDEGALLGQIVRPLARVGIYVPGGTAAYPSTVIMNVIPAQVAGVKEIVIATPPAGEGEAAAVVMAAADLLGIDRILLAGGAQAIAALAYGTESCPAVDKITGPGNRFVAAAKRQVYGTVDIDMIAGPSEILVIADAGARPAVIAADLLSQAEHDPAARVILLTPDADLADRVERETEAQLLRLPRKEIAQKAVDRGGSIILTKNLAEAVALSNRIAPEHLSLQTRAPFDLIPLVENAGSVFVGGWTPEALGDYLAGPNHTLPTAGTARFSSPLSVADFQKKTSVSYFTEDAFRDLAAPVQVLARKEGLTAHAQAVSVRLEHDDEPLS